MFASPHPLETHITNLYVGGVHMLADKHFFSLLVTGHPVSHLGAQMSPPWHGWGRVSLQSVLHFHIIYIWSDLSPSSQVGSHKDITPLHVSGGCDHWTTVGLPLGIAVVFDVYITPPSWNSYPIHSIHNKGVWYTLYVGGVHMLADKHI